MSLLILSVISVFTIPKVLQAQGDTQKRAVLKEIFGTVSQINYTMMLEGTSYANQLTYVRDRLNYVKWCAADMVADGCRTTTMPWDWHARPGALMHNGATISVERFAVVANQWRMYYEVDYNGDSGPNLVGTDIFIFVANTTNQTQSVTGCATTLSYRPGEVGRWPCTNESEYSSIFGN